MALVFDIMPRTEENTKDFYNWRELPFTAVLIVAATLILSDDLLVRLCLSV